MNKWVFTIVVIATASLAGTGCGRTEKEAGQPEPVTAADSEPSDSGSEQPEESDSNESGIVLPEPVPGTAVGNNMCATCGNSPTEPPKP